MNSDNDNYDSRVISEINVDPEVKGLLDRIPDAKEFTTFQHLIEYEIDFSSYEFKTISKEELKSYRERVLIAIFTSTVVEKDAVLRNLIPMINENLILKGYLGNFTVYIGRLGVYPIILTKCEPGIYRPNSIIYGCEDIYANFKPKIAILFGIAFGLKENGQKIGDVLISERIIPYEMVKYHNGKIVDRSHRPESSELLQNRFKEVSEWRYKLPDDNQAKAIFGSILSGEKLLDDRERRNELKSMYNEAIGGDMEGAGFATSFMRHKVDWIVVKGICDWAYDKGDKNHKLASKSAISLITTLFNDIHAFESLDIRPE